ncbi:hypothetical protein E2562_033298 [Oryza meyeriana var. granulata]|uniref:MoeA C-terminal domain-containing protein n=1 Tax=Oryza meyeriana var. granulata TaxID=110450 RepID=A0A6G1F0Y3_9ORYZ|nr:hypothetical protein E2562_033298 [Oryza meyeriana var. granulata]
MVEADGSRRLITSVGATLDVGAENNNGFIVAEPIVALAIGSKEHSSVERGSNVEILPTPSSRG